jgi:hypothetical protein
MAGTGQKQRLLCRCFSSPCLFISFNIILCGLIFVYFKTRPPRSFLGVNAGKLKIAVITASFGLSKSTARAHERQTIPADCIVFTDNPETLNHGNWTLDTTPYHKVIPSPLDTGNLTNSLSRNRHPYMLSKYYKMQFHLIPRLRPYDIVVWIDLDKTMQDADCLEYLVEIFRRFPSKNIIAQSHWPVRECHVALEVEASIEDDRWNKTMLYGKGQPLQDVRRQWAAYLADGYTEDYWARQDVRYRQKGCIGLWQTNFMAFRMSAPSVREFLDGWYLETLRWSTQCQVSAPYVLQKVGEVPYTLPDARRPFFPMIQTHSVGFRFLRRDN